MQKKIPTLLADEDREKAGRVLQAMLQVSKIEIDGLRRASEGSAVS
jgi:hypothetical protein